MRTKKLALSLVTVLMAAFVVAVSPAAAQLDSNNTISWGVTGLATGTQTDTIRSSIFAIEQIGNRVYVGGRFLAATNGGTTVDQPFLAAFDATTGEFDQGFRPVLDGPVYSIDRSADGSSLFVGGEFSRVGNSTRRAVASLNPTTGALNADWSGRVMGLALVRGLDVRNGWLYVGGRFNTVSSDTGAQAASQAVRFDVATGSHDRNWRPTVSGGSVWSITASPSADRVYLAGYFDRVNGADRTGGFAALEASSDNNAAGVQPFRVNTNTPLRQYAYDVEVAGGKVWVGGSEHYVQVLNESDLSLIKFHYVDPRGDYQDLEVVGNRVYAGCHCSRGTSIWTADDRIWFRFNAPPGETNGNILAQSTTTWIAAFDANSGDFIPSFYPGITSNSAGVWGIHGAPDGCLWIGGQITTDGSGSVDNLVRLCEPNSDGERPTPPRGLAVDSQTSDSATLKWLASTDNIGVTGYNIYDADTNSVVATSATSPVTINGLTTGTHRFYAKAFDAATNLSWRSNIETVVISSNPTDTERPTPPRGLTLVSVAGDSATLSWMASTDNVGVTGYNVYSHPDSTLLGTSTNLTIVLNGLADGTHQFYVKAVDAAGNESWRSNLRSATIDNVGNPNGCTIWGTEGDDVINGTPGNDVICALGGNDVIRAGSGNDIIYAGPGNDDVEAGDGDDTVYGEDGDDILRGGGHNDSVFGGPGNDTVNGWRGDDQLDGGPGTDSINGGDGVDTCTTGETVQQCE